MKFSNYSNYFAIVLSITDFLAAESDILKMKCRVDNTPYSLFGTWYNESFLLSGNRFWLGGFDTSSLIYMNRASQEISSEHIPVTHGLFKFYNTNQSTVTSLLVAKCFRHFLLDEQDEENSDTHFDKSRLVNLGIYTFSAKIFSLFISKLCVEENSIRRKALNLVIQVFSSFFGFTT